MRITLATLTLEHVAHAEQTRVPLRAPAIGGTRSLITWPDYIRACAFVRDRDAGAGVGSDQAFLAAAQRVCDALNEHAAEHTTKERRYA